MQQSLLFSDRLRELMKNQGINAARLSGLIGISHVAVGNYLEGRIPKAEHLFAIAKYFGVSMEFLLSGELPGQSQSQSQSQSFKSHLSEMRIAEDALIAGGGTVREQQARFDGLLRKIDAMQAAMDALRKEIADLKIR